MGWVAPELVGDCGKAARVRRGDDEPAAGPQPVRGEANHCLGLPHRHVLDHVKCRNRVVAVGGALQKVQRVCFAHRQSPRLGKHGPIVIETEHPVAGLGGLRQKLAPSTAHVQQVAGFGDEPQVPGACPPYGFRRESALCVPVGAHPLTAPPRAGPQASIGLRASP